MADIEYIKKKAKAGDAIACYDLGILYYEGTDDFRKHRPSAEKWLIESSQLGYQPAMLKLAEFYQHNRKVGDSITPENATKLNSFGCELLSKHDTNLYSVAYTLIKIASLYDADAKLNLAYCKFEGIGIKKNLNEAFTIIYSVYTPEKSSFIALKSSNHQGFEYTLPKSKVEKKVAKKEKRQERKDQITSRIALIARIVEILLYPLFLPLLWIWTSTFDKYECHSDYDGPSVGVGCIPFMGIAYLLFESSIIIFLVGLFTEKVSFSMTWYLIVSGILIVLGFLFFNARDYRKKHQY